MKKGKPLIATALLSLLIWAFFYFTSEPPLNRGEIAVVVIFSAIVVFTFIVLSRRFRKRNGGSNGSPDTNSIKLLFLLFAASGFLFPPAVDAAPVLACSVDRFIAYPGDIVEIRLSSTEAAGFPMAEWAPEAGQITRHGNGWQWSLAGTTPGLYRAILKSAPGAEASDLCRIKVIVRLPPLMLKGTTRTTALRLLLPGEDEAPGYGLYSYLLFASKPDTNNLERYLNAIEEFLKFPETSQIEKYMSQYEGISLAEARMRMNLAYMPVAATPDAGILSKWSDGGYDEVSQWVIRHYDFTRAQAVIHRIGRQLRGGPYIVSLQLSERGREKPTKYLFQNQSWVPAHLISSWMNRFLYQAAQEDYWQDRPMQMFALKMRATVGVLAIGVPQVQKSIDELVQWSDTSQKPDATRPGPRDINGRTK